MNDELQIELDGNELKFKKKGESKGATVSISGLKNEEMSQLCFCVCLNSNNDKISIV